VIRLILVALGNSSLLTGMQGDGLTSIGQHHTFSVSYAFALLFLPLSFLSLKFGVVHSL